MCRNPAEVSGRLRNVLTLLVVLTQALFVVTGYAAVPRVAIFGQGNAAAFADVLNAAFSSESAIELVERAELDRLTAEVSLNSLGAAETPAAIARLARADAFLFVTLDEADQQHSLLVMRLTQTTDSRVLHGLVLPWLPKELEANSKFAVAQFAAPLKRLATAGGVTPLTVSLLGLRAAVDDPKLRSFETSLNLLLAHRLAVEPGLALMERWRLDDVVFERSLAANDNPGLTTGAMLVDGSFTGNGNQVELRFRLRNAESDAGSTHTLKGSVLDAMPLVEAIVEHIAERSQNKSVIQAWQPQQEARAYAELGTWMVKHRLAPQAAEAFESAIALGNSDPLTFVGRVQAYAMTAYPMDLRTQYSGNIPADKIKPDDFSLHLTAAIRSVKLATDYMEANPEVPKSAAYSLQSPIKLGGRIFHTGLIILQAVHEAGRHLHHGELVSGLRMALHRLVACMDSSVSSLSDLDYNEKKNRFAAYWCVTPRETLMHYAKILDPDFGRDLKVASFDWQETVRRTLFPKGGLAGPFLEERPQEYNWLSHLSPTTCRLIDWDETGTQNAARLWRDFVVSLRTSSSPSTQADGLAFEISSSLKLETKLRLLHESVELLWKHRSLLPQQEGRLLVRSLDPQFPIEKQEFLKAERTCHLLLSLCRDLFEKEPWVPDEWLLLTKMFGYDPAKLVLSEDEKRGLFTALASYGKRIQGDARLNQRVAWAGKTYFEVFTKICGELADGWPQLAGAFVAQAPMKETFTVTHYWNLFRQVPMGQELRSWRNQPVQFAWHNTEFLNTDGTRIWLSHEKAGVLSFDPMTLQTEVFGTPPGDSGNQVQQIVANEREICAASRNALWRFDRSSKQWTKLDVPDARYCLGGHGGEILVAYAPDIVKNGGAGAGIGRLTQGGVEWLVSTRRRPVEHVLDAIDVREMYGVFFGPQGSIWTSLSEYVQGSNSFQAKVYSINDPLPSQIQARFLGLEVFSGGNQTLLWERWDTGNPDGRRSRGLQAWRIRVSNTSAELLVSSDEKLTAAANVKPHWPVAAMLDSIPPDTYANCLCPAMHGDELWMLYRHEQGEREVKLIGLLPGRNDPVWVPLKFVLSEADRAAIPSGFASSNSCSSPKHGMVSTNHALALCGSGHGVWLIPWSDLHDWLAKHPQP